ncbi:MAG TPA: MBOAT family O-acyltransferase [Phycisphaerae bacterium]|nr:MBOAT family protein [Phycisphaerae bacterium]HOB73823.1 MBOAT family O-acyltransferase [Phycisphaerae bacterium]HOJ53962.1 MBOAT family O-acyltransferase [Phycisphaerae bacterium]HOL27533.1 MBOAT family O-acyltransferase [Phycisphaerae bacterium]HPP22584.1 MBOAT family O-acyltransferase [Phycisphaerae bacterium]
MTYALIIDFARWDGWLHLVQDGHDLPRGPIGVLAYLPLAVLFWWTPRRWQAAYLWMSSLLLAFVTLGPGYAVTLAGLAGLGLLLVRTFGQAKQYRIGLGLLVVGFAGLIVYRRLPWLPRVDVPPLEEPMYFYLHWAGIAYTFLRIWHVLVDVAQGKLEVPRASDFFAYLLFAPTLRMGPLYRFNDFAEQLHSNPTSRRGLGAGLGRIAVGLVRLGIMGALLDRLPLNVLYDYPGAKGTFSDGEFLLALFMPAASIYLWISGYTDLAIGTGRVMGFAVPENFNYPWASRSIAEFWRRWHLTLGSWLRDYIYIPLGGNRRHVYFNYVATFVICGAWHGVRPAHIAWGLSQGIGLAVWRMWSQFWARQAAAGSALYRGLRRLRLVDSPISAGLAWGLTFAYQIITIVVVIDERHSGRAVWERLAGMFWGNG